MLKYKYLYLLLFLSISCKKEPKQYASNLEKLIELSGSNRLELEKVLTHYSKKTEDSLKYKAAVFLIENMKEHSYRLIRSRKEWDNILELSDSLIQIENQDYETIIDSNFQSSKLRYIFQKDLEQIKAKDLIENIDAAFNVWPRPWNSFLDFDGFCNYILPYRQKNEPVNFSLRKKYYQKNQQKLNDSASITNMIEVANEIKSFPYGFKYKRLIPFDQSIEDIEKGKMMDCVDASILSAFKGRSMGIPMAIDFALWPNIRGSHYWNSVVYSKDSILYADSDFFWGKPGSYRLRRKTAKIYRIMYASQKPCNTPQEGNKTRTFLDDNPNIIDVTSQYIKTTNVKMKLRTIEGKIFSTAYLCIFNDRKWRPVAKSPINHKAEAQFNEVGRENIYIIFYINGNKRIPASEAFSLDKEGNIFIHKADIGNINSICLDRKSKLTRRVKNFGGKMAGGIFQLSNTKDFEIVENVYRIAINDTVVFPRIVDIRPKKPYRYARYRSPISKSAEIAEMKWLSAKDTISGTIIGTMDTEPKESIKNVFDGDELSYFSPNEIEGSYTWVGLDFGEEKKVSRLKFSPRSDVNYVKHGDTYELVYWENEWVSLGKKTAKNYYIRFEDVPENSLLWLRNLSEGIEEELFIYENDEQFFWNSSEVE